MITLQRTDSSNPDFIYLVRFLDQELAVLDGDEHAFYAQFNKLDHIHHVVIAYDQESAVGCGAIKPFDTNRVEIKRMYTAVSGRGKGIATKVLNELEQWARELGNTSCVLETGKKQPEAINLYKKQGYQNIANYGQYEGMDNSLCFEKVLINPYKL